MPTDLQEQNCGQGNFLRIGISVEFQGKIGCGEKEIFYVNAGDLTSSASQARHLPLSKGEGFSPPYGFPFHKGKLSPVRRPVTDEVRSSVEFGVAVDGGSNLIRLASSAPSPFKRGRLFSPAWLPLA